MKRELAAVALLLVLLGGSLVSLAHYDRLTDRIEADLRLAMAAAERKDFPGALAAFQRAENAWLEADGFTHIFIRHPEIDGAADAFFDLKEQLLEHNAEGSAAAFEKLLYHLDSIDDMEHPRLGSIF